MKFPHYVLAKFPHYVLAVVLFATATAAQACGDDDKSCHEDEGCEDHTANDAGAE